MNISNDQQKRIKTLIRRTWNVISMDYITNNADETVEVVLDADYTTVYGEDKEADAWLRDDLSFEEQDAIAMTALFGRG